MFIQGTLDEANNVVIPSKPMVWVDTGGGGGGGGASTVEVSNFPATQPVSGSVSVTNFPTTQPVSIAGTVGVSVDNFPATQPVTVGNFPATQPVSIAGTIGVSVDNFPATQPVTVGNFPATQPVSGPLTNAQLTAIVGTAAQTAVTSDPTAAGQTMLALLRGILTEMQTQTALLEDIKTNTTPEP